MSRPDSFRTAAVTARLMGVSVRALRVYERHGLMKPGRTAKGWRVYGPDDFARLHQVLALKRLGLSLARISVLLKDGTGDLDQILALQESDLLTRKHQVDRALELVRRARAKLKRGEALPTDDLVELTKETAMSDFKPGPEFLALVDKHVDVAAAKALHPETWTAEDQAKAGAEWTALIAEADRLKDGDPGSPEAQDLARRWAAQVMRFTKGDAKVGGALTRMYQEGSSDPAMAGKMPFSAEVWSFMVEAQRRMRAASGQGDPS